MEILFDVALMIVPVVMLWKVKVGWGAKARVWCVGVVGVGNIVTAIGRTAANFGNVGKRDFTCMCLSLLSL